MQSPGAGLHTAGAMPAMNTDDVPSSSTDADNPPCLSSPTDRDDDPVPLRVELNVMAADTDPPLAGWFEPHLARIAADAGADRGSVVIALVDDLEMTRLNERYKGHAGTTDVLCFDLRDRDDQPLDADVVICRDEAQRQARHRGHDARLEILLYSVHALLHLLGYDDHNPAAAAAMHRREDQLLVAAGFNAVYGDATMT
jgi:probable rRNA maturation factor